MSTVEEIVEGIRELSGKQKWDTLRLGALW